MVLEIDLISGLFLLNLSHLLKLVVVDIENLSLQWLSGNLCLGKTSMLRGLEANESIKGFTFLGENLDALDFSVLFKVLSEFSLSGGGWEVLNVEIASLL